MKLYDIVYLVHPIQDLSAGAEGVIVYIHHNSEAYEVEFETPRCVLTLTPEYLNTL